MVVFEMEGHVGVNVELPWLYDQKTDVRFTMQHHGFGSSFRLGEVRVNTNQPNAHIIWFGLRDR